MESVSFPGRFPNAGSKPYGGNTPANAVAEFSSVSIAAIVQRLSHGYDFECGQLWIEIEIQHLTAT